MKKREFLKKTGIWALGAVMGGNLLASCNTSISSSEEVTEKETIAKKIPTKAFELPTLEYDFNALAPNIDATTMEIHYGKHHAGYVKKLNAALDGHAFAGKSLRELFSGISDREEDIAIRNNGGGHFNHSFFWKIMGPNAGGIPEGKLAEAINGSFDSFENFSTSFKTAAASVFGSGWAWLCVNEVGNLFVTTTPNQDNPLMKSVVAQSGVPILGLDVWEHAYYLNYQNQRKEYINNFFKLIRWDRVADHYNNAI